MRSLVIVALALVACSSTTTKPSGQQPASCPPSQPDLNSLPGSPCTLSSDQTCFVENEFSDCESAWFRCVDGAWTMDHALGAADGASCADAPVASCDYEGNPNCSAEPTSQSCECGSDGTWHCTCACYGTDTSCPIACPSDYPGAGSAGPACSDVGFVCMYSAHSCTCADTGQFNCN